MAFRLPWFFFIFTTFFTGIRKAEAYKKILVDQSGRGNFANIQSAVNSVPSDNNQWILIHITAGTYREKVTIPSNKPYIILEGEGMNSTQIIWGDYDDISKSATFSSTAHDTVARNIKFVNSYNRQGRQMKRAVAAMIGGDKSAFYGCGFYGLQDTLWDAAGRHYFKGCTIQGAIDFIFGAGQSIYEGCRIEVHAKSLNGYAGVITAQGRERPGDSNGFVFKQCEVFGSGSAFLGRPWRQFARVLFYYSELSGVVDPRGWDTWNTSTQKSQTTFAEYGCHGAGAGTSRRVPWEKKLSSATIRQLTSISFIDNDGWIKKQLRAARA